MDGIGSGIGNALSGLLTLAIAGVIAMIILAIVGIYSLFSTPTHETKKLIKPDVVVESRTVNGVHTTDTTYIYTFK